MYKFSLLAASCLSLILIGCSPDRGAYHPGGNPQALLESEGSWQIVEEQTEIPPDQMHMQARNQVDASQMTAATDTYTEHFQPADLNEDTRYRVLRLEKKVDSIDKDFKQLLPPLKKLIVPGDDLDRAVGNIESRQGQDDEALPVITERRIVTNDNVQKPATAKNDQSVGKPVMLTPADPQPVSSGVQVTNIRTGEHPGKTRLVIDTSGPVTFKSDIDNNEKLLLIEIKDANLAATAQKDFINSAFLKSYTAQKGDGAVTLAIELKKPAKILGSSALKPDGANGHRVFFDIGSP